MENIEVKQMSKKDIDDVWNIEKSCFETPWSKESFRMEMEENKCARYLIAKVKHKTVGYGGMWLIIDEAHITNIAVHPDYRKMKVGESLLKGLMKVANSYSINQMTLEVRRSNIIAQNLYKKLGFQSVGYRKKYYNNTEDAMIMWNEDIQSYI